MNETWPLVHAERAALAADLGGLSDPDWAVPSLCAGLSVREVLAHLTAGASLSMARWLVGVLRCRFDFDAMVAMRLRTGRAAFCDDLTGDGAAELRARCPA
ncbi:maleylpyruvate isomerase N-terminal domain-containing protein [Streptomonospora nanhaiensis]|uniref:maleylpyruvate isomerase N-terminal domain-containing protein n=1 Tax=Streptomonospora nanhaiensis TaxID=1323731 RepID=UPI001C9A2618|nr:maleylpyruvate isomerase N-terminal domain-containing protein [Streptomonospora nanhaiensis]